MSRAGSDLLSRAAAALHHALLELEAPHVLIGGLAVIARGVERLTADVDAAVRGEGLDLERAFEVLGRHGIEPRIPEAKRFARERQILLLRHENTGTKVDLSLAWLPFEDQAIARAESLDLGGVSMPVALPEDLIVYKAVAWRVRDREDIERLLTIHARRIDLEKIRGLVADFAAALEEPERVKEFEQLVQRVRGRTAR